MNDIDRKQLLAELGADREALLDIASGVNDDTLTWPTRNAEWAVRDVLAHVLASDADLISLLEAATGPPSQPVDIGLEQHQQEMARWASEGPDRIVQELTTRGDRWRTLMGDLPDSALVVAASWREHDRQHAEDVRLALDG